MKKLSIVLAVIAVCSGSAFAEDTCQAGYSELLEAVQTSMELSDEVKAKFVPQLDKALQLCKEGKLEEASKIVEELRKEAALAKVFSNFGGN